MAMRKKTAGSKRRAGKNERRPAAIARLYPSRIGSVCHYYPEAEAAAVRLESGELHAGDTVHIRGQTTDFYQRIETLRIDDRPVEIARAGQTVGIRVSSTVRENDSIFLLSD